MNVYDQEHRDTNNLIWKWHKIPTPTNNNKGRKPDVIWDEFNRFTKVAKYEDTGNPVDMNSSIKADCKHCDSTDICGTINSTKLGQILNLTIDFRKRRGFSKASWKLFPRLGIHSSYDQSIKLLEAIEDDHEDNELIGFWCKIGIRYCSMAAAQGRLESSFGCLTGFHTPERGGLGVTKLRTLDYCYNQNRNIKRFDAKWKPNEKVHVG
eukprot:246469_1